MNDFYLFLDYFLVLVEPYRDICSFLVKDVPLPFSYFILTDLNFLYLDFM